MHAFYLLALLVFLCAGFFVLPYYKKKQKVFQLFAWCGIILFTVFLYSARDVVLNSSFFANLVPGSGYNLNEQTLIFKKSNDGHFYINAKMHNRNIKFLVDTGASDIVLTRQDAQKVGIKTQHLRYTKVYQTASGKIHAAPVVLGNIKIRNLELKNVRASVSSADLPGVSVLGMSFLENFTFSIRDDKLQILLEKSTD